MADLDRSQALILAHGDALDQVARGLSPLSPPDVIELARTYEAYLDGSADKKDSDNNLIHTAARVAHEANRVLQLAGGEEAFAVSWEKASAEVRNSAKVGVKAILNDPNISPEGLHDSWCNTKRNDGWTFAPVRNDVLKHHPCLVPYDQLPPAQRIKDAMFQAVVRAVLGI